MDSSSFCTSESIRSVSHLEEEVDSIEDRQDLTLPLTSSNLEMLQITTHIHAKHQYIAAYVKNQIAILALEAKLQHQRWREMQTLVPLETAPFEKETIVCCTDFKDADEKTNHSLRGKTKEKANMSECQTPTDAKLTPKIKKRHSWILAKRSPLQQRPRRHHSQNHSFSYLSTDNSAHHQQKYNQEKMDLIKQGLCGSSSSCLVASPSLSDDHLSSSTNNNQLASLLFSSLISSCTSTSNSSSFSFLNALKESTVVSHSILPAEDPPRRRPRSVISSPGTSISSSSKTMGSKVHSWWKRRWTAAAPRDLNCHHHNHAEFLAFRYPKMIPFQKLRDTALQLLLSSDTNRCSDDSIQQDKSPSFSELPSS